MLKTCGLLLTTALLLSCTSCTTGTQSNTTTGNANATPVTSATPALTTASPTATSPTPTTTAPTTATVKGSNFKWTDDASGTPVTTIKVGGKVTWTITQGTHRLETTPAANGCQQLDAATFNSVDLNKDQSVTRTFNTVGTFGYKCGRHDGTPNCNNTSASEDMWGIIKVVP